MILLKCQYSKIWSFLIVDIFQFLNVPCSPFQKNCMLESWHNWLLSNWSRLLNRKGLQGLAAYKVYSLLSPSPPNCSENSWKLLPLPISINWPSRPRLSYVWFKRYSKMHPVSCANTWNTQIVILNIQIMMSQIWLNME